MTEPLTILHIGPHKSGTTSIQLALYRARSTLLTQHGIRYLTDARRINSNVAIHAFRSRASQHLEYGSKPPRLFWSQLREQVLTSNRSVVSAESLSRLTDEEVTLLRAELAGTSVRILITMRPLVRMVVSQWQQIVQNGPAPELCEFSEGVINGVINTPRMKGRSEVVAGLQHDALVRRWSRAFGPEKLEVVVADDANPELLYARVADVIGVPQAVLLTEKTANRSLTWPEAELIRATFDQLESEGALPLLGPDRLLARIALDLKTRRVPPGDEHRVKFPEHLSLNALRRANDFIQVVQELGVRVRGDLSEIARQDGLGKNPKVEHVTSELAANVALSALRAIAFGRPISDWVHGRGPGVSVICRSMVYRLLHRFYSAIRSDK